MWDQMWDLLYQISMALIKVWYLFTRIVIKLTSPLIKWHVINNYTKAGIGLDGKRPFDMKVHSETFYERLAQEKSLGLGEMYMEGLWDCEAVDELFSRSLSAGLYKTLIFPWDRLIHYIQFDLFNLQTAARAFEVGEKHYDQGNALFESFLDPTMNYSCGYWKNAKNLTEAQLNKMDLIGRKLKLEPGMRVLDIGCGWGGLCKYLAENYQVEMVGCTISVEGAKVAKQRCKGLNVDIRVVDYREIDEKFDRIVSVGMFEHVGHRNYRTFFKVAHRCLVDHGIFLLHTIGLDNDDVPAIEPWFNTYIFPNGILPYHTQIPKEVDNLFTIEDWENFGNDYNKTLMAWHTNFVKNWPTIEHLYKDPKKFYRMWTYYLLISAGGFRSRRYQLWQVALSKRGVPGGYESVR